MLKFNKEGIKIIENRIKELKQWNKIIKEDIDRNLIIQQLEYLIERRIK